MSRFFPQAAYAEDQSLSHTILITHVLYRGFQAGAGIGAGVGGARALLAAAPWRKSSTPALASAVTRGPLAPLILRSTGTGALVGTGLLTIALVGRMWARDTVEWQDRSWRLLANPGQVEVDDWSGAGAVAGAAAATQVRSLRLLGMARAALGGAGAGTVVGVVGYMAWRYGMHGGRR